MTRHQRMPTDRPAGGRSGFSRFPGRIGQRHIAALLFLAMPWRPMAAAADDPLTAATAAGLSHGMAVAIAIDDERLLADLAAKRHLAVHALVADGAVDGLRARLRKLDALGPVQVSGLSADGRLPYASHASLVVLADAGSKVDEAELARVVAPGGSTVQRRSGAWTATRAAVAPPTAQWPHPRGDAGRTGSSSDASVGPPQVLQWLGGPLDRIATMACAEGTAVLHDLTNKAGRIGGFDAHSGTLRWWMPARFQEYRRWGMFPSLHSDAHTDNRLVAVDRGRVVLGLLRGKDTDPVVVDLHGGKEQGVLKVDAGERINQILARDGTVWVGTEKRLLAFDIATRALRWQRPGFPYDLAIAPDGTAVYLDTDKQPYRLVAVDGDGRERWVVDLAAHWTPVVAPARPAKDPPPAQIRLSWVDADLVVAVRIQPRGLIAFATTDGKQRWTHVAEPFDVKNGAKTERVGTWRLFPSHVVRAGKWIWYSPEGPHRVAIDPQNGTLVARHRTAGSVNEDCQFTYGTPGYFLGKDTEWLDVQSGATVVSKNVGHNPGGNWTVGLSRCRHSASIAYGLTYWGSKDCYCATVGDAVRVGVPIAQVPAQQLDDQAVGVVVRGAGKPGQAEEGWSTFRSDARRSGWSPKTVGPGLRKAWTVTALGLAAPATAAPPSSWVEEMAEGDRVSAPVAVGTMAYLSDSEAGTVIALDLGTGAEKFRCLTGSRLSGPPTLAGGRIVAGGHDGWMHCWSAQDGALIWRTRLATGTRLIPVHGRWESAWPVCASVLVNGQMAMAMCGRFQRQAEGVWTAAVDLDSGALRWRRREWVTAGLLYLRSDTLVGSSLPRGAESYFSGASIRITRTIADGQLPRPKAAKGDWDAQEKLTDAQPWKLAGRDLRPGGPDVPCGPWARVHPATGASISPLVASDGATLWWTPRSGETLFCQPVAQAGQMGGDASKVTPTWKTPMTAGETVRAIAASPGAVWIAVAGKATGELRRLDPANGRVIEKIDLGGKPAFQGIALHAGVIVTLADGRVVRFASGG